MAIVLLQLMLVVGGYACVAGQGAASMAGMSMPTADASEHVPARKGQQDAPCQFPWAPGGCQTMAPCAPVAITVASSTGARIERAHEALQTLVLLAPSSVSVAPELPPPRA